MIKTQPGNNTHHDSTKMDKLKMPRIVAESIVKQEINRLKTERAVMNRWNPGNDTFCYVNYPT